MVLTPESGGRLASRLGSLPPSVPRVAVRDGLRTVIGVDPDEIVVADGPGAFAALDSLTPGWWAGFLAYDLGRSVERVRPCPPDGDDARVPDLALGRFDTRLVVDPGGPGRAPPRRIDGDGPSRRLLEELLRSSSARAPRPLGLGAACSTMLGPEYRGAVRTVLDHLRAGDCYQVNLTRRLVWDEPVDPTALFARLAAANPAPHAALIDLGVGAVASVSPERFLAWDGSRVESRPIKGTAVSPSALRASAKDRAENVMIVDLARNDLGRVCAPGTVRVPGLCELETHPGLFHLVSTVRGERRPDVGLGDLLRATFPPASVTGAPKPRVMQIIEELEGSRRGLYCGALGWVDTLHDRGDLAVAIRTFSVAGGRTELGVGAGIVADSDPEQEWQETRLKAARLLEAVQGHESGAATPRLVGTSS